jgi:hypothetical protein
MAHNWRRERFGEGSFRAGKPTERWVCKRCGSTCPGPSRPTEEAFRAVRGEARRCEEIMVAQVMES